MRTTSNYIKLCSFCHKPIPRKGLTDSHYKRRQTCGKVCAMARYKSGVLMSKEDLLNNPIRDFDYRAEVPRDQKNERQLAYYHMRMNTDPEYRKKRREYEKNKYKKKKSID